MKLFTMSLNSTALSLKVYHAPVGEIIPR